VVVMLGGFANRGEGGQSCPKIISDIVPPHISTHHADRGFCILEAALRCRPRDLKKKGFGLVGPLSRFFSPSRREFIAPISKGSGNSALRVLSIDAFSQCVALFQLLGTSRVWWSGGCWRLGCPCGLFKFSPNVGHGPLINGGCLGWRATGTENEKEENTKQFVCH
jgi:hypothetical protein